MNDPVLCLRSLTPAPAPGCYCGRCVAAAHRTGRPVQRSESEVVSASTPGPWEWWTSNSWRRLVHQVGGTQIPVLTPHVARDGHPDLSCSEADMALISSAPDLLDALKAVVAEVSPNVRPYSTDSYLPQHIVDAVRAAIDKAEGRS